MSDFLTCWFVLFYITGPHLEHKGQNFSSYSTLVTRFVVSNWLAADFQKFGDHTFSSDAPLPYASFGINVHFYLDYYQS